jgi:hypothetical protein
MSNVLQLFHRYAAVIRLRQRASDSFKPATNAIRHWQSNATRGDIMTKMHVMRLTWWVHGFRWQREKPARASSWQVVSKAGAAAAAEKRAQTRRQEETKPV